MTPKVSISVGGEKEEEEGEGKGKRKGRKPRKRSKARLHKALRLLLLLDLPKLAALRCGRLLLWKSLGVANNQKGKGKPSGKRKEGKGRKLSAAFAPA